MFKFLKKHLTATERPSRLSILDFAKADTFPRIQTTSDSSLGGFSTAYFEPYRASANSNLMAHFHGNLNQTLPKGGNTKVKQSGWAMFKTKNRIQDPNAQFKPFYLLKSQANFWWDWSPFEVLHLRVMNLTPNRKFMVNIQTDTMSRTDLYQHRLFTNSFNNNNNKLENDSNSNSNSNPVWENIFINLNEFVLTNRRHRSSSISI
jgi:NADH dehydrogenase [ubiquinone] 1 alpha subcomplex assembly factor 1